MGIWAPPIGTLKIHGLLVPPGKASFLLTYLSDLKVNRSGLSLPKKGGSCQTNHTYKHCSLSWVVIFEALFGCHSVLIWDKRKVP